MSAQSIEEVLRTHTDRLMAIVGVVGTAEGQLSDGTPCILVLVEAPSAEIEALVPKTLGGHPVEIAILGHRHSLQAVGTIEIDFACNRHPGSRQTRYGSLPWP